MAVFGPVLEEEETQREVVMRACVFFCGLTCLVSTVIIPSNGWAQGFIRGDANEDGNVDLTDAVFVLNALFASTDSLGIMCEDAADTDDDGSINLTDAIGVLSFLFRGGEPPAPPFQVCGDDPTDDALSSCNWSAACRVGVFGLPVSPVSAAVVFVIERSGFLQSQGQLDAAKFEVEVAIHRLRLADNAEFGVVYFDQNILRLPDFDGLLPVTESNTFAARGFVSLMQGGSGFTCPQTALMAALRMTEGANNKNKRIVYIGSGQVSCQGLSTQNPSQILDAVREENAMIGATIHTVGILDLRVEGRNFLNRLAEENGGSFVHVVDP